MYVFKKVIQAYSSCRAIHNRAIGRRGSPRTRISARISRRSVRGRKNRRKKSFSAFGPPKVRLTLAFLTGGARCDGRDVCERRSTRSRWKKRKQEGERGREKEGDGAKRTRKIAALNCTESTGRPSGGVGMRGTSYARSLVAPGFAAGRLHERCGVRGPRARTTRRYDHCRDDHADDEP